MEGYINEEVDLVSGGILRRILCRWLIKFEVGFFDKKGNSCKIILILIIINIFKFLCI